MQVLLLSGVVDIYNVFDYILILALFCFMRLLMGLLLGLELGRVGGRTKRRRGIGCCLWTGCMWTGLL